MAELCRHCGQAPGNRARGLCRDCFGKRSIRRRYRMLRKSFHPDRNGVRDLPHRPTDHLPGTEEKLRVLRRRLRDQVQLWHPDDARIPE